MPINTAHNGAVSDRSKPAVSFNIDHIVVTAHDIGGMQISQTVTNGGTAGSGSPSNPVLPYSIVGIDQGGFISMEMAITFGDTGGSKRPAGGSLVILTTDEYVFGTPGQVIQMLTHQENPNHPNAGIDEMVGSIGFFQDALSGNFGWDEPYYVPVPRPGGDNALAGAQNLFIIPDMLMITAEEILEGGQPESTGQFQVDRGTIHVIDLNTGVYVRGPQDNFTFNIRIVP